MPMYPHLPVKAPPTTPSVHLDQMNSVTTAGIPAPQGCTGFYLHSKQKVKEKYQNCPIWCRIEFRTNGDHKNDKNCDARAMEGLPDQKNDVLDRILKGLGILEGAGEGSKVTWRSVGGYIEPCLAILGNFEGHLGLSRALLEPSWAKKGGVEGLWERLGGLLGPSWAPWLKKRRSLN